jgi:hypothetical protein
MWPPKNRFSIDFEGGQKSTRPDDQEWLFPDTDAAKFRHLFNRIFFIPRSGTFFNPPVVASQIGRIDGFALWELVLHSVRGQSVQKVTFWGGPKNWFLGVTFQLKNDPTFGTTTSVEKKPFFYRFSTPKKLKKSDFLRVTFQLKNDRFSIRAENINRNLPESKISAPISFPRRCRTAAVTVATRMRWQLLRSAHLWWVKIFRARQDLLSALLHDS